MTDNINMQTIFEGGNATNQTKPSGEASSPGHWVSDRTEFEKVPKASPPQGEEPTAQ